MCTRLLKKASVRARWTMLKDKHLPYELIVVVQKQVPKFTGGLLMQQLQTHATRYRRYATEAEAKKDLDLITKGVSCIRCGQHPRACTKRMFRKWD